MEPYILVPPRPTTAKQIRSKMYFYIKAVKGHNRYVRYLTKQMEKSRVTYSNTLLANDPDSIYVKNAKREYTSYVNHWNKECDLLDELEYGMYYWKNELDAFKAFNA